MRRNRFAQCGTLLLACLAALVTAPDAWAQDGASKPPAEGDTTARSEPVETPSTSRRERADALVASLEGLLAQLEKNGRLDEAVRKVLVDAIAKARLLAEPLKVAELTDDERAALEKQLFKERLVTKALEGAGLSQAETSKASELVSTWYSQSMAARSKGEAKQVGDLKRKRDKDLKSLLGRRKAQRVINNLNRLSGPGYGGGGYGGGRPR